VTAYTPRGDSLAARVLKFFLANPDEELSVADIACKFSALPKSVPAQLYASVEAGILTRGGSDGVMVYRAGKMPTNGEDSRIAGIVTTDLKTLPWWGTT
jgi:hypothetical protein